MTRRRLVICFDGTWNTPDNGANPTNVVKLLRAVRNQTEGVSQITFYDKGVGTGGPLDRIAGGASGAGLTENMLDGYRFLANNFEAGDEIYLFGFSRGAYTARSLAGFLALAGLIAPAAIDRGLAPALAIYRDKDLPRAEKPARIAALGLERLTEVPIRCIGVWDTVGSLGIPGDLGRRFLGRRYYFHDVELGPQVAVALHAIAIDEKRSAFAPALWVRKEGAAPVAGQVVEQVWFPGVHSNVGGSYADAGLSDIALDWLIKRVAALTELAFDAAYVAEHVQPDALGKGVESRSALYADSRLFPYQRLIAQVVPEGGGFGDWFRRHLRAFDRRNIPPAGLVPVNEMLHVAALERWREGPVMHDCPEGRSCAPVAYRPVTLAALIAAVERGAATLPVVGWDGALMPPASVPWPAL